MLFYSFFKTLVGKEIVVELKNGAAAASLAAAHRSVAPARPLISRAADLAIRGTLHSVDQFLNIKLLTVSVEDSENFPHMVRRCAGPRLSLGRAQPQPQLQPQPHPQPLAPSPSAASRCPSPSLSPARLNPHRSSNRSNRSRTASSAARSSDMCSSHPLRSTPSYCKMRRGASRLSRRTADEACVRCGSEDRFIGVSLMKARGYVGAPLLRLRSCRPTRTPRGKRTSICRGARGTR